MVRTLLQLNVLVALASASVAAAAPMLIGTESGWTAPAVAFAVTLAVYNFDRIADTSPAEGHSTPKRAATVRRMRRVLVVLIPTLLLGAMTAAAFAGFQPFLWSLAFPLLGVAYVLPVLPSRVRRPKDVPYLKCFYVAACCTTFVGLGLSSSGIAVVPLGLPFAALVFVRIFASTFLGDLRDVEDDAAAGLETIASRLGPSGSERLLDGVHLLSAVMVVGFVRWDLMPSEALALLVPSALGFGIYRLSRRHPEHQELLLELYDLDFALFAPALLIAAAITG